MRSRFQFIVMIATALVVSGCVYTSPEVQQMSQSFSHRHPDYVVRSTKGREINVMREAVEIEFDAPDNLKNHGHADLIFDKQADGSWICVSQEISMWTK
jgi:hypothetical protein